MERKKDKMKKTYELNYGNKATVNVGNYENLGPMYNLKLVIETEGTIDIGQEFIRMKAMVDKHLANNVKEIKLVKLLEDMKHLRFYEKDGIKLPSVTTVISPEPYTGNPVFGTIGDILHRAFSKYIKTGDIKVDITSLEKDQLIANNLNIDDYVMEWIKYDEQFIFGKSEQEVFSLTDRYAGTYDADGLYGGVKCVFDLKSGSMLRGGQDKAFMQLAAYSKCLPDIKRLVIIPCNPKSKQDPLISDDIDKYYSMFMQKRKAFKDKFGV